MKKALPIVKFISEHWEEVIEFYIGYELKSKSLNYKKAKIKENDNREINKVHKIIIILNNYLIINSKIIINEKKKKKL